MKLTEADIARQVDDFMAIRNWRIIKTHSHDAPTKSGARVPPERGMPDRLCLWYPEGDYNRSVIKHLWVEFKAPGKKLSADQEKWIECERLNGALVAVVDDIDIFMAWYAAEFGAGIVASK